MWNSVAWILSEIILVLVLVLGYQFPVVSPEVDVMDALEALGGWILVLIFALFDFFCLLLLPFPMSFVLAFVFGWQVALSLSSYASADHGIY